MRFLVLAISVTLLSPSAPAAAMQPCAPEKGGPNWHYRTKVPGYSGDVRGDRCWYDGPAMLPREQLFWPAPEPMVKTWDLIDRWRGEYQGDPGWSHKE